MRHLDYLRNRGHEVASASSGWAMAADMMSVSPPEGVGHLGLQHTHAWTVLQCRLTRLLRCLQSSSTPAEQQALKTHFASQLVEQAKEYSSQATQATAESSSQAKQGSAAQQLNSLALLACASIFDRLLRQQTAHRVREVLALSGPLAGQESAALQSAWSMFMQQASSTLGDLGSGWSAAGSDRRLSQPPSPPQLKRDRNANASGGSGGCGSSSPSPQSARRELGSDGLPRNGSLVFDFED